MTPEAILETTFGYTRFRGEQRAIIQTLLDGGDALVLMPTGGGKSLCYQIPAMLLAGTGVVVSPLIALMANQVEALRQLGVAAACLNSTLERDEQREIERRMQAGELDLLYIAPERLLQSRTLDLLAHSPIGLFAIDEAHCVSQWGHDFRPEYLELAQLAERFPGVPRIALTATADLATRGEILERLAMPKARVFVHGFDRPNIRYRVAEREGGSRKLLRFIREEHPGEAGIVYCLSRAKTERTAEALAKQGVTALPYHAGLDGGVRERHQQRFLREDGVVIVATVAFGMGIDKPDVRFVAHLDMPASIEAYYQETGRAGRDGEPADAWMLYGLNDVVRRRRMIEDSEAGEARKRVERQKLEAMLAYCELATCRRVNLLGYFGETLAADCGNCDNCLAPPATWEATEAAQKLLSAVYRTGERFGAAYLAEHLCGEASERADWEATEAAQKLLSAVYRTGERFGAAYLAEHLCGEASERAERLGHTRLSTFGVGTELAAKQWRALIRQLVARGALASDPDAHGGLHLAGDAREILGGRQTLRLRLARKPARERAGRRGPAAADIAPADEPLWEALRAERKRLADEQSVPAFVVFSDATLRDMLAQRPTSPADMLAVHGVGEKKLERYGEAFLRVIVSQG